jgi:hypothetical protein
MMVSTDQQIEFEKPTTRVAYFLELFFDSGTVRVCNSGQTFTWNGYDWIGLGSLGTISPVNESEGLASDFMVFSLNIAQVSVLGLALGSVSDYRGKTAKLYYCPLDEQFRLVDTPQQCWKGVMDSITINVDNGEGSVALKCETSAYGLLRRTPLRINAAQHLQRHPGDTGLDYLSDLIANPQIWLSKKFQQI